jgi:hypothetical protein
VGFRDQSNGTHCDSGLRFVSYPRVVGVLHDGRRADDSGCKPDRGVLGAAYVGLAFLEAGTGARLVDASAWSFDRNRHSLIAAVGLLDARPKDHSNLR